MAALLFPSTHHAGRRSLVRTVAVPPNFTFLIAATRVGLPQVFALLTAAESQSLVSARRSIGGLGRRLPAQRGLDGVEFGPRAAEL